MKKIFGIKIGGLQQKIINIVVFFILAIVAASAVLEIIKTRELSKTVSDAKQKQTRSIEDISQNTMKTVVEQSTTTTTQLEAYISNEMFSDVKTDILILQETAQQTFEKKDELGAAGFSLPDPSLEGEYCAQVLSEADVDPFSSELLGTVANMQDMMVTMCKHSEYMYNCYMGLADGSFYLVDPHPENKYDENGDPIPIAVRQRPWYLNAVESGEVSFSGVIRDTYLGEPCVTCSAPVYANGELYGVVAIDVFLTSIEEYVEKSAGTAGFICIVNDNGQVVFAPKNNGVFYADWEDEAEDLRESENQQLASFVKEALSSGTKVNLIDIRGKEYYMTGVPMNTVGWTVISVINKDAIDAPTNEMLDKYDKINEQSTTRYKKNNKSINIKTLVAEILILALGIYIAKRTAGKIVKPIETMTSDIMEGARTGKLFEMQDIYRTKDEIEVLAEAFDDLSKKTRQYIIDITEITKEKERIGTELELARKIQADMLPSIYPAFPDRTEFDIYATMTPAKEVGGDFYDFFLIDDDHLGMVMADVSGKGVPAALFMMMSKIIINNLALQGCSPAEALEMTNEVICQNNDDEMFITVWLGVLEISTGKITAANAGHEFPMIRKANGDYEMLRDKHGFVVGGLEDMKYTEYEIQLDKGGALFLYTDGVIEATNSDKELFGIDRLLEVLNENKDSDTVSILSNVRAAVDGFAGEAEQFDDLTMLVFIYHGNDKDKNE